MSTNLTPEETFLYDCARLWRTPAAIDIPGSLNWDRIAGVGVANRMATLLKRVLTERKLWESLPEIARQPVEASADRLAENAVLMSASLSEYLREADARGLDTVVLKGLSISCNIYGDQAMRPGGDIDILVPRAQVPASIELLEEMGIGPFWPNLMADAYYEHHHLHHQRCTPDLKIWIEIHWALDHPYTLLTIDYDAMIERTTPGALFGQRVQDLSDPDLLLSLCVHLVKHAVYLPSAVARDDLGKITLADGMLMYYLDVAEVLAIRGGELDWNAVVSLARDTGTVEIFGAVLRACQTLLGSAVPQETLAALPVGGGGPITRWAMEGVVERELAQYQGAVPSKLWDALLVTNGAFILRPIRLIESASYFFPPRDFLERRYGSAHPGTGARHLLSALKGFARFGWDSVYFAWERHQRLKRLGHSTSLFNRLETEG